MGIEKVPGTDLSYYLVSFDDQGRERTDDPRGLMSDKVVESIRAASATDVFLMSHGWKGDVPAAKEQYANWVAASAGCNADRARIRSAVPGFSPLIVGLHWPSLPWGAEELRGEPASFGNLEADHVGELVDDAAKKTTDTAAAREALRTIFETALDNPAPPKMPDDVRRAYMVLNAELGLGGGGHVGGTPAEDRAVFDPELAYENARADAVSFGPGSIVDGLLSPLVQLSFWKMKDRARNFGESGGFGFLGRLMNDSAPRCRFHLMGHSFGCIAMSAILVGPKGKRLPKPADSAFLVQGALSLWSYSSRIDAVPDESGYFARILSENAVAGPIVTTQSPHDTAVGRLYPLAAGAARQYAMAPGELPKYGALGTWGAQGGGVEAMSFDMLPWDAEYGFERGKVYNLEAGHVIKNGGGLSGAHNDIAHPEVAHASWSAALVTA